MIKSLGGLTKDQLNQARKKAQTRFENERAQALIRVCYPRDKEHADFKGILQKLLRYNSKVEMGVHELTWDNLCTFKREFFLPEMDICFQILVRATPFELSSGMINDEEILTWHNEIGYPQVMSIVKEMSKTYFNIDQQVSIPIAQNINKDIKLSLGLAIGTDIKFVIPEYKWGASSDLGLVQEKQVD